MKSIYAPHIRAAVKLGRRRPPPGRPKLRFGDYVQPSLPAPPASCDFSAGGQPGLGMIMLNDQLGDCVIAAGAHVVALETGNAGEIFIYTQDEVLADYSAIGGYKAGDPSTDQGCDEQTAFAFWQSHGFADGTKLDKYLALDLANPTQIQQAMDLFENLYFGVGLPDAWITPFPAASGFVWDAAPTNDENGHAFMGVGYNDKGVQIDTWGLIGTLTWGAMASLAGSAELYTLLTPDQLAKASAKAPSGMDWDQLSLDFIALVPRGGLEAK